MTDSKLVIRAGSAASAGFDLVVTPESAQWGYSSLRTLTLPAGAERTLVTVDDEFLLVPLSGAAYVRLGRDELRLEGRVDVFSGSTDFAYLPIGAEVTIGSQLGGRFAFAGARTDKVLPFRHGPAVEVPVELRGAGQCSRLVRNFGAVDAFETGAVIACEVVTPGGNWSSYPAHKHDEASDTESELEEIYYFEIADGPSQEPGFGYHRTSSSSRGEIDVLAEVRDRDVALVPYGWHGPCVAAPGFDMYYLNVMAGPAEQRAWLISDHPDQAWVRDTWNQQQVDPRLVETVERERDR
jgi:5-deoxy-glucuronate isomerase